MTNSTFTELDNRLNRIETRLNSIFGFHAPSGQTPPPPDEFLNVKQASAFLGIAPQTIYQNIRNIPHFKRFGKLFFKRAELVEYLETSTRKQQKGGEQL
jgi:predicted DNA-binding transcriptional regulator AlpA